MLAVMLLLIWTITYRKEQIRVVLSVIATTISSVASIGVAIGLLLQSRQVRISQIQAVRSLHTELIKLAIENPSIATAIESGVDTADAQQAAQLNLLIMFLQTSYLLKVATKESVSLQAQRIFAAEYPRYWWASGRDIHIKEAATKRDREFVTLVDAKFQEAMQNIQPTS